MIGEQLLSWVTFLPLLAVGALLGLHGVARGMGAPGLPAPVWRGTGLFAALATFGLSLQLWSGFDATDVAFQFVEYAPWLPDWGIHYFVGIDGISLLLVLLTTFLVPLVLIGSWDRHSLDPRYVCFMLGLETAMVGTFVALNLFQFYVLWEIMLVPMLFIIGIWGGERRVYAAVKFLLFTLVGSLLMLVGLLALASIHHGQFGVWNLDLARAPASLLPALLDTAIPVEAPAPWWQRQGWLFAAFGLAFAIKVPLVPFHTWLPDAHVEAPTGGSVLLAAVLLKMGTYGYVRFALPLFPVASEQAAPLFFALALVGILYGALVAMVQSDVKKLVAYSSVAHLGFVVLGIFALTAEALVGSVIQMVNHGLSTGALFFLVGMLYERRHTREIADFGGVARPMPVFAAIFVVVVMSSIGLPLLNGFVGEFLILLGVFGEHPWVASAATVGVLLAAVYMLWMTRRVLFGPVENPANRGLIDLDLRERAVLVALLVPILWIGVHPTTFLSRLEPSVAELRRVMDERGRAIEARTDGLSHRLVSSAVSAPPEPLLSSTVSAPPEPLLSSTVSAPPEPRP